MIYVAGCMFLYQRWDRYKVFKEVNLLSGEGSWGQITMLDERGRGGDIYN